jgi:hypothetical protein
VASEVPFEIALCCHVNAMKLPSSRNVKPPLFGRDRKKA